MYVAADLKARNRYTKEEKITKIIGAINQEN
jgi:hypothetical protein